MKKNRYAIYYKTSSGDKNYYEDQRTFKTIKWAATLLFRLKRNLAPPFGVYIKEVQAPITDGDMLNFLIENRATVTRLEGEGIATNWFIIGPSHLDHLRGTFKTPREAIKSAMENYK